MFECYEELPYYAWAPQYRLSEAIARGSKDKDGEDTPIVLLYGTHLKKNGFYLFTKTEASFYPLKGSLNPEEDSTLTIEFDSPNSDPRKIWVRYLKKYSDQDPVYKVMARPFDGGSLVTLNSTKLNEDQEAYRIFAVEIARVISLIHDTYEKQPSNASNLQLTKDPLKFRQTELGGHIFKKLEECSQIEDNLIKNTVTRQRIKFNI